MRLTVSPLADSFVARAQAPVTPTTCSPAAHMQRCSPRTALMQLPLQPLLHTAPTHRSSAGAGHVGGLALTLALALTPTLTLTNPNPDPKPKPNPNPNQAPVTWADWP